MRKLVMVNASPHENGSCAQMLAQIERGAREAGYEIVRYDLNRLYVNGCQGCGHCKKHGVDCIQEDDLTPYWRELHEAEALVVASPNYCGLVNGDFLNYMARHYCLLWSGGCRLHPGVKLIGCFSQGREDTEAYIDHYDHILEDFENRDMGRRALLVYSPNLPEKKRKELLQSAYEAGRSL